MWQLFKSDTRSPVCRVSRYCISWLGFPAQGLPELVVNSSLHDHLPRDVSKIIIPAPLTLDQGGGLALGGGDLDFDSQGSRLNLSA